MASAAADVRECLPDSRVLLVVGSFHVAHDGGTKQKLRRLRRDDRIVTLVYRSTESGDFALREEDRGAGEVVIYGLKAPPRRRSGPPATMPAAKSGGSRPAGMP